MNRFIWLILLLSCVFYKGTHAQSLIKHEFSDRRVPDRLAGEMMELCRNSLPADSPGTDCLSKSISFLHSKGYLEARVDSSAQLDSIQIYYWYTGPVYRLAEVEVDERLLPLLNSAGIREREYSRKPLSPANYTFLQEKVINWCSDNGYPFARITADTLVADSAALRVRWSIDKGPLVKMDSLIIRGNARISKAYLYNYLSLRPGSLYNETLLARAGSRIKELNFIAEARPFEVELSEEKARPVFFLQSRKASQFSGIIGFQPDDQQGGKTYITGDIRLKLQNSFGRAEVFDLSWTNPQARTQDLKVLFSYPFLFGIPLGVSFDLKLYKRDTLFLEFFRQAELQYFLKGANNYLSVFASKTSSNLISTKGYENISTLPEYADVSTTQYGLTYRKEELDFRWNPRKGYSISGSAGAGIREIKKNQAFPDDVFDSLELRQDQYRLRANLSGFYPLSKFLVSHGAIEVATLSGDDLFQNELFRLGGLKSLRGFDEQSVLASTYLMYTGEIRFLLEEYSYFQVFLNQAFLEYRTAEEAFNDEPFGFGAGIVFGTRLGIFSFSYALGSRNDQPIQFRDARVHFGLLSLF